MFGRRAGDMKMASLAAYFGLGKQTHRSLDDVRMNLEVLKYCATVLFLVKKLKKELGQLSNNPQGQLLEAVHSAGYSGALANPLVAPKSALNRLDGSILENFVHEHYTALRMVLTASAVNMDEILSVAEPLLFYLPGVPRAKEPKSVYVGGDYRRQADLPVVSIEGLKNNL